MLKINQHFVVKMKLTNSDDNFHLQQQLEALKGELANALLKSSEIMGQNCLVDVVKLSSVDENQDNFSNVTTSYNEFKFQVEYIRSFLLVVKVFPKDVRKEMGWKALRECDKLLKAVFHELGNAEKKSFGDCENHEMGQDHIVSLLILPTAQLIYDCVEMNVASLESGGKETETVTEYCMNIFGDSMRFLVSPIGISLEKSDFMRIMGVSQKVWKFVAHIKQFQMSPELKTIISKLIDTEMETIEGIMGVNMLTLLSSENGVSFLKFWCEIFDMGKESKTCANLQKISSSSRHFPEIYMVFTSYYEDAWFWRTNTGKALTPVLIRGIIHDMSSNKTETRKRAAFVLKHLVTQYSQNNPIFDASVPEVCLISLKNMELRNYTKFWDAYFDIHDILNETQLHIVQPVLQKLDIFKQHSSNDSVLVWLPILLKKMIGHDNRSVVKEGFVQFLMTGDYLENQENTAYFQLAKDFMEKFIMPLIRDHIGWILNEPSEFFKNISTFGHFILRLYSNQELSEFKAAEVILDFLTSSGKCMGPHTIFFLVASLDEIFCDRNHTNGENVEANVSGQKITSSLESIMNHLALLMSTNLTTVSKYFRELLEERCVSILLEIMPYVKELSDIQPDSFFFMKLLAFLGSISAKVFYAKNVQCNIQKVTKTVNQKGPNILCELTTESKLYHFAKSHLSSTSTIGMLRYLAVSSELGGSEKIVSAIEQFAWCNCKEEILPGCVQALHEFYQQTSQKNVGSIYTNIFNEVCKVLATNDGGQCSQDTFMFCIRRLEVLSSVPRETLDLKPLPDLNSASCRLKSFLLLKLYILTGTNHNGVSVDALKDFSSKTFNNFDVASNISDSYFALTERNIFAEYLQMQFCLYTSIIENMEKSSIDEEILKLLLSLIVDELEKCNWQGVAAGLSLAKSMTTLVDYNDEWDGSPLLNEIASVSWSLVFEFRKSEAFWVLVKAFVELISCPYFVHNGYLNKYAELLFEHGENVSGLPLVLVQQLVRRDYPEELLGNVHEVLVKAALAGGPLAKNIRVSFAIWDYLRRDANEEDYDPEKYVTADFSSDCKARLLACEKLRSNIDFLMSKEETRKTATTLLRDIVDTVLQRDDQESKNRKRYFQGSLTHRIKQRTWQLLLTLQPYFDFEISQDVLEKALLSLSADSPQPSVRYMGEWLIILVVQRYPELNSIFFDCLDNCIQTRLGFGAFFSTICVHVSKLLKCSHFFDRALQSLASLTLSQHLTVRIYAQIAFQKIYERALELKLKEVTIKYESVLSALSRASAYVSGNCSKLLDNVSQDFYVNVFDSTTHYCPEVIFTLLPRLSGMIKDECILQPKTIRKMLQEQHHVRKSKNDPEDSNNESAELEKLYMEHEKSAWHLKTVVADGRELGEELPNPSVSSNQQPSQPQQAQSNEMNYQKKINPWKILSASEEIEEYANTATKKRCISEDGLVVVASLLDHLPNLGGLCRTCEIFGVQKYVINSLKVVNDQHFQSLSVSAQNWVNILEVPVRDLESFLLTYSTKGYRILGVEQANESTPLTDFVFPKKSVLLLGNEKLGIPPELLHLVDKCIEIPQVGLIRSLNVHVTGALCIWQYTSQNII